VHVPRNPVHVAELVGIALVGGALALGGAALFGKLGSHTTIKQISPLAQGGFNNASLQPAVVKGLTPEQIYRRDAPGVVQITATTVTHTTDPFSFAPQTQTAESLGSGFVIDKAGHIVTNYHVIQGATKLRVSFSGQDQLAAAVVGSDPSTDTAVLKVNVHARALTPLPLGDSDAVTVGDAVYAIGNPFGFTRTLTSGLVSAVQRQILAPTAAQLEIDHAIQTDAAINHGNSGGPLIDAAGRVIGVTSQISTGNTGAQGNIGIGFAIPINTVRNVAAQIVNTGKAQHPFIGISSTPVTQQLATLFKLPTNQGLLIESVEANSGAKKAGLRAGQTKVVVGGNSYAIGGDIIVGIDGQKVSTLEELRNAIAQKEPGDKVKLEIYRGDSQKTVSVTLGQTPR
jgi:putative serine protease PepD